MQCEVCRRIHHELPDLLVPYKRYTAESMEQVIDDRKPMDVAADESTLYRWHAWFRKWIRYVSGCFQSIAKRFQLDFPVWNGSDSLQTVLREFGRKGASPGWLANIVRPVANAHFWVHTRSAFLSGVG